MAYPTDWNSFQLGSVVTVENKMQKSYRFRLEAPRGESVPGFTPALSPNQMLRLGVFGGVYMRDALNDYPDEMISGMRVHYDGPKPLARINAFGVLSGDNLAFWRSKNWIHHDDPRGWFEWYCRFWLGRRHEDDLRQINRWKQFAPRHQGLVRALGEGDPYKRAKTRQSLLHWSHDPMPDIPNAGRSVFDKTLKALTCRHVVNP